MLLNIKSRSLTALVVLLPLLAISMPLIVTAATSNLVTFLVLNSGGIKISSIFRGLKPDPRFAQQLALTARKQTMPQEPSPAFMNLVYRVGTNRECVLAEAQLHRIRAAFPQGGHPCYGQYMEPQWNDCGAACDEGIQYEVFYSTGSLPHNGYYVPLLLDECNGCVLPERGCYNP
jgi:hypothetical protein